MLLDYYVAKVIGYRLWVIGYRLQVIGCRLQVLCTFTDALPVQWTLRTLSENASYYNSQ